ELTVHWAEVESASASAWLVRSADSLPPELPTGLVGRLAAKDPESTAQLVEQLPSGMRLLVAGPVALELARRNPFAAVSWIEQFREYTEYRDLYRDALTAVAAGDPPAAAAMVAGAPPAVALKYDTGQDWYPE